MVALSKLYPEVIKVCRPFIIENEVLKVLAKKFSESVSKSLSAQHAHDSTVKCNLTHITDFPDGKGSSIIVAMTFDASTSNNGIVHPNHQTSWLAFSPYTLNDEQLTMSNRIGNRGVECPQELTQTVIKHPRQRGKRGITRCIKVLWNKEKGSFIGLEFSGKIFRLVYAGLKGDRSYISLSRLYEFPYQRLNENFKKVVDYVAKCINNFIEIYDICEKKIILGVTCSFPIEQECLQEGKILCWGKDFQCYDLNNQDFYAELKISLKKFKSTRGIFLISLINNSTASLLYGLYKDPSTRIGLFLGDETNITYLEKFENMTICTGDNLRTKTAVGVEMKNFGDDGALDFVRTEFDFQIDASSSNPGKFVLDKMVSGASLGEIARLCLHKLVTSGIILNGYVSPALSTKDSLKTADMAMMEIDPENTFIRCKAIMLNLGYKKVSDEDCIQIRFVCRSIIKRSSNLVAACLSVIIHRIKLRNFHIMADGYLIKEFPDYENYLLKKIKQLKKPNFKYELTKGTKDDLAVGAGLAAHIYKDGIIKLEEKHRMLPPFNINKYNLTNVPLSCIDCNCETEKIHKKQLVEGDIASLAESEVIEIPEPVITSPNSFDN